MQGVREKNIEPTQDLVTSANLAAGIEMPTKRTRGVFYIALLWILQSALRLIFGYLGATGFPLLDVTVPRTTLQLINIMLFLLGIGGLTVALGLLQMKNWGFWGAVTASVATIIFDLWGLTIQFTAIAGFIVPVISLIYLYAKRKQLFLIMD